MSTIFTEIRLTSTKQTKYKTYQLLKSVPSIIMYRELSNNLEVLSIVLFNDRYLNDIKKILELCKETIDSISDIQETRLDIIKLGEYEEFIDGYDVRNLTRFWTGNSSPCIG